LVFSNLGIYTGTILFYQMAAVANNYDIELLKFEDCIIDLSSGSGLFLSAWVAGMTKARLGHYLIDRCIIYAHAAMQNGVYGATAVAASQVHCERFTVRESTIANTGRGIFRAQNGAGVISFNQTFTIERSTFYKTPSMAGQWFFFETYNNPGSVTVNMTDVILHLFQDGRIINFPQTTNVSCSFTNFYCLAPVAFVWTNTNVPSAAQSSVIRYTKPLSDLFPYAGDNPTTPGVSFKIGDPDLPPTLGDPRWN